jgi:3-phosphoshikimate 1-carboxyvinyltransferase
MPGAPVEEILDTLRVDPGSLHGAEIETYGDHRVAVCFGMLGLRVPGIRLRNPACVRKIFPNFFIELAELRGRDPASFDRHAPLQK